ncbi:hypothetical protein Ancab_012259 [Ancistrocladus abbreviatus]
MEAPDFLVEDLLDLPTGEDVMTDTFFDSVAGGNSTDSSTFTAVDSCNSSISGSDTNLVTDFGCRSLADAQFSGELCVPYDDLAELEWLSNFVEESFSTEDLHELQLISGPSSTNCPAQAHQFHHHHRQPDPTGSNPIFKPETAVPGKARSKLSRVAPSDWSTRLLMVSPAASSSESNVAPSPQPKKCSKKRETAENINGEVRRCLHCAAEKTPQWRTGPMGPKTLCNACGVRYKSGRLVPEYRPAASPTFISTKHSNSHRKVLELRRQKELQMEQQQHQQQQQQQQQFLGQHHHHHHQNGVFGLSNSDDYLIHHHMGPDYRQMI